MNSHIKLSPEFLLQMASQISSMPIATISQQKLFSITVEKNKLVFKIANGKRLPATIKTLQKFCEIYNLNQSLKTKDYIDDLGISTYLLALVSDYLALTQSSQTPPAGTLNNVINVSTQIDYWWVNQNQTYIHEVPGGYMWSPKKNKNGARNQFYDNMKLTKSGDIVFSYCDTYIKAIGKVMESAISESKPVVFGNAGANWNDEGWLVRTEFIELKDPIKPKELIQELIPTLPIKYSPLQKNGDGLQSVYLAGVPNTMAKILINKLGPQYDLLTSIFNDRSDDVIDEIQHEDGIRSRTDIPLTHKLQLIKARRGQGQFRNNVRIIEQKCRITGIDNIEYLIASHIKPWCKSEDYEKLDGNNGLLMSPHVDRLFDRGYISFDNEGNIILSSQIDKNVLRLWNIDPDKNYGRFSKEQIKYLNYHRQIHFPIK